MVLKRGNEGVDAGCPPCGAGTGEERKSTSDAGCCCTAECERPWCATLVGLGTGANPGEWSDADWAAETAVADWPAKDGAEEKWAEEESSLEWERRCWA